MHYLWAYRIWFLSCWSTFLLYSICCEFLITKGYILSIFLHLFMLSYNFYLSHLLSPLSKSHLAHSLRVLFPSCFLSFFFFFWFPFDEQLCLIPLFLSTFYYKHSGETRQLFLYMLRNFLSQLSKYLLFIRSTFHRTLGEKHNSPKHFNSPKLSASLQVSLFFSVSYFHLTSHQNGLYHSYYYQFSAHDYWENLLM